MYLSKKFTFIFRKTPIFSFDILKSGFKISLVKTWAKIPEDDPNRPPLRLNIPKDVTVSNPYELTYEPIYLKLRSNSENEKFAVKEFDSSLQSHGRETVCLGNEIVCPLHDKMKDNLQRTHSNPNMQHNRISPKTGSDEKIAVKTKSFESLAPVERFEKEENSRRNGRKRKFTLKKEQMKLSSTELKDNDALMENNVMTIRISLDNTDDWERSSGSRKTKEKCGNLEEDVRVLTEAIVNEVKPKTSVGNSADHPVFFIINVVDQNDGKSPSCGSPKPENERKFFPEKRHSKMKIYDIKQSKMAGENLSCEAQGDLPLNNFPQLKIAKDSPQTAVNFQLDSSPSSTKVATGIDRKAVISYPGEDITAERYEPDITDITLLMNKEKTRSDRRVWSGRPYRSNRMRDAADWRRWLDDLKFKPPCDNRAVFRNMVTDNFEMNTQCLNSRYSPKLPFRASERTLQAEPYGTGKGVDIGDPFSKNKKDVIINVMKNGSEKTPKFGDGINKGNEAAAKDRGTLSIDSLSMMKKVKEMVDVDLKNAGDIFMMSEEESTSAERKKISKEEESQREDLQTGEKTEKLKVASDASNVVSVDVNPAAETVFDGMIVGDFESFKTKSIVIYDDATDKYYIHLSELETAIQHQIKELRSAVMNDGNSFDADKNLLGVAEVGSSESQRDFPVCAGTATEQIVKDQFRILKKGDSAVVFDEEKKNWKVDFEAARNEKAEQQQTESGKVAAVDRSMDDSKKGRQEKSAFETNSNKTEIAVGNDESDSTQEKALEKASSAIAATVKENPAGSEKEKSLASELKRSEKKSDGQETQNENSYVYENILTEVKKPDKRIKGEGDVEKGSKASTEEKVGVNSGREQKKLHYLSDSIAQVSQNVSKEKASKPRTNKYETVKLNISSMTRPPSKVTEINLNRTTNDSNDSGRMRKSDTKTKDENEGEKVDSEKMGGKFYKKFERYNSPFSDPEYEEGPPKINSDLKSNPNLKKLDLRNKTLVLQDVSKLSENIEYWLKDDANKMATILLKVLQDAAEDGNKRKYTSERQRKGNPYEAIRKKQEEAGQTKTANRKKDTFRKKSGTGSQAPTQSTRCAIAPRKVETVKTARYGNRIGDRRKPLADENVLQKSFPMVESEVQVEVVSSDVFLQEPTKNQKFLQTMPVKSGETEDIPGPAILKKVASLWRRLPDLGCQMTIFSLIWIFQTVKMGLSTLTFNMYTAKNDPFGGLFAKYGPVVKLQSPLSGDIILVNRPQDIASVFATEQPLLRSVFDSVEECRIRTKQKRLPAGAEGLCAGIEWDSLRKSTADASSKGYTIYFSCLNTAANLLKDKIRDIKNNHNQVPEDFMTEIKKWSLEGMCNVLFDLPLELLGREGQNQETFESEQLFRHLEEATEQLCKCESHFQTWRFFNTPALAGLNNAYQSLDLIMSKYIHQAEIKLRKKKHLMTKKKFDDDLTLIESMLINDRMMPQEIASNLIDILLVGYNTTSIALGFLLYHLSQNNKVQNHLFKEVKDMLPEKTSTLNYHQMHTLKYLQACLKETLRLNTPIPFQLRVLLSDIALSHYRIPSGTHVVMDFQTACMRAQNFEEPDKFKPERWFEQACDHPFASIPFCHGPCSGFVKRLAEMQLWTCIAKIVRNYEMEYHFEEIRNSKKMISYPDKPLKMVFIERKK